MWLRPDQRMQMGVRAVGGVEVEAAGPLEPRSSVGHGKTARGHRGPRLLRRSDFQGREMASAAGVSLTRPGVVPSPPAPL